MEKHCDIYCVGNAVVDVLARPVESLPRPGASDELNCVALGPGGNAVNTAIASARLGSSVRITAAVGDDRLGNLVREALRIEGVDDTGLITVRGAHTSLSVVLVQGNGERRLLHYRGANSNFAPQHVNWEKLKGTGFFFFASAFALPAFDGPPLEHAMIRAKESGCMTALNTCWDTQERWLGLIRSALAHTDYMFPNIDEGRALTGESEPPGIASALRRLGVQTVIVKLGPRGCYVEGPEVGFYSTGFAVEAVDTTGAGDCFAGAFLTAISRGDDIKHAARFANAAAALCTLGMGGGDSSPRLPQVEDFLRQRVTT
jgi:sugar/nucleoside kinase (ribokinase family)